MNSPSSFPSGSNFDANQDLQNLQFGDGEIGHGDEFAVIPARKKESYLRRIGGGSLTLSILVHVIFILIALFLIKFVADSKKEEPPDFLPGGGGGGKSNNAKVAQKKKAISMNSPKSRIVSVNANSAVTLPEVASMSTNTDMSGFAIPAGGKGGGEGGQSGKGKGGMLGDGMGKGFGPGNGAGFVSLFGTKMNAKKLGVVIDVSGSMHAYIEPVVKEANKIAGGVPFMIIYGCGVADSKINGRSTPEKTAGKSFDTFWRTTFKVQEDASLPPVAKTTFDILNNRKDTFFYDNNAKGHTDLALTSNQLSQVDTIYWFADFQDVVDKKVLEDVQKTMEKRKQKLILMHVGTNNRFMAAVEDAIVKPTGGLVKELIIPGAAK